MRFSIKLNEIIKDNDETNIEEAKASEKEFLGLVKGSKVIILKKCKISKKIVEDENGNVFEITRFKGGIEFMSTKKIDSGNDNQLSLIIKMINDLRDDMNKGFTNVHKEISIIKEDIVLLKEDVADLKNDVTILKEDVAILKQDVSKIMECPTIKKELLELENKPK